MRQGDLPYVVWGMCLFKQNSDQVLNDFSGKMFTVLQEVTTNDNNDNM